MRSEQAIQPNRVWKETLGKTASVTLTWVFYSACLAILFTVLVIELVPLGPKFKYSVLAAWVLAVSMAGLATALGHRRKQEKSQRPSKWTLTQRQKTVLERFAIPAALAGVIASILVPFIMIEIRKDTNSAKSEAAGHRFTVTSYVGRGSEYDIEAFEQTLAELEDSYQRLKGNWTVPPETDRVRVWVFRDVQDYRARTGQETANGHVWCSAEYGPTIAIPLEDAPSMSDNDTFSRTPVHEVVHALMCQSLGEEAFRSIPSWFHEGLATKYQTDGFRRIVIRAIARAVTWWTRNEFMEYESFCKEHPSELGEKQQGIFYATALEFTKFLESTHGIETLNLIVDDVRTGTRFDESMESRIGGTCEKLYSRWKDNF